MASVAEQMAEFMNRVAAEAIARARAEALAEAAAKEPVDGNGVAILKKEEGWWPKWMEYAKTAPVLFWTVTVTVAGLGIWMVYIVARRIFKPGKR